ncbi:MAG: 50S ribosomal protein L21 [Bdellovibrio sp. CG10_big_fil_rev_8_21_14_0_10_47_8]|nr:MAG: 50S ribosomal protein L21 [Bdellovibrio sp. CG10_big_fil_rev_8_21_14_0_10_47_8]
MYAIIRTGGKQYKVQPGDIIRVEKLENALGTEFDVTDVLLVGGETAAVGSPTVENAKVTVVVTKQTRDKKVVIFKKKRRQGYRRFKTHRQPFTELFVKSISMDGKTAKADETANVIDVDAERKNRIAARSEKKQAPSESKEPKAAKKAKAPVKKAAPKKAAKKTGTAKKKAGAKKSAKKTVKKTSKKA